MLINNPSFKISTITPEHESIKQPLDVVIKIAFTKMIDKASIPKNFIILKDKNKTLNTLNDLKTSKFEVIKGKFDLNENVVSFTPNALLDYSSKYVIIIRSNLKSKDIEPIILGEDSILTFYTMSDTDEIGDKEEFNIPPKIIYPSDLSIVNKISEVRCEDITSNIEFQISDDSEFNNIIFTETVEGYILTLDKYYNDGQYYIRAKHKNSDWSDTLMLFLQNVEEGQVTEEDRLLNEVNNLLKDRAEKHKLEVRLTTSKLINPKTKVLVFEINEIVNISDIRKIDITRVQDITSVDDMYENVSLKPCCIMHKDGKTILAVLINI